MSDDSKPNKNELIPSTNRSLVRRKGLVKRGLDLIPGLKRQQVRVQIGNFDDDGITEICSDLIKEVIKDKYDLKLGSSFYGEELIELAENAAIDIFILIINNIRFRPDYSVQERLENSLQLIIKIKTTTGRPVIALSGLTEDSSLIAKAKHAADFYFPLPCKPEVLMEAFEKCLEMLPGFVEVPRKRFKGNIGHTAT
jgi:CheY-like chemotaxis protein